MAKNRSRSTTARNRIRPAHRCGVYLVAAMLLSLGVTVAVSQLLWAEAAPEPAAAPAVSTASPATNTAGANPAPAGDDSMQTLNLYGGGMRPLVEERGGVQTLNIYGPWGEIIAQVVQDGQGSEEVRYLLTDHLGSTRVVVDAEGNAVARYEYAPHGETTVAGSKGAEVRYRYTGHPYDEGQEVYETPNRGYDPTVGRFLSVDPQRQDASPYVYAGNNPVGYLDPAGGVKVPFFMQSGMGNVDQVSLSTPISKLLAPTNTPRVSSSDVFHSNEPGGRSYASLQPYRVVYGQGEKEIDRTDEFYWFIKDQGGVGEGEESAPNRILESLGSLRGESQHFARRIVLLDFSTNGLGSKIEKAIPKEGTSIIRIEATPVPGFGGPDNIYMKGFMVQKYPSSTKELVSTRQLAEYARARMVEQRVGTTPPSTTHGTTTQATGETVTTTVATTPSNGGVSGQRRALGGGAMSQPKVPKSDLPSSELVGTDMLGDVSLPFHELPP